MKGKRRIHSAEFKARVAREAMRGVKTVAQIAEDNGVHPVMVSGWKKEAEEGLHLLFEKKRSASDDRVRLEEENARLAQKLGQVVVEKEWLEKKRGQLGVSP